MVSDPLFCISHSGGPRAGIRRGGDVSSCVVVETFSFPSEQDQVLGLSVTRQLRKMGQIARTGIKPL